MANAFSISINAVDNTTKVVKRINESLSKLTRPVHEVVKSVKAFGTALVGKRIIGAMGAIAGAAMDAAKGVARMAAPVLALVGGGTIAGIAALSSEWARLGTSIYNTSLVSGVSTLDLQKLQGAARALGLTSGDVSSGLTNLGMVMREMAVEGNVMAVAVFSKLGVSIHKTATGAYDSVRALKELGHAMNARNMSPQTRMKIAQTLGIEALLPMLSLTDAELDKLQNKVLATGGVMDGPAILAARLYTEQMSLLWTAVQGLTSTIGAALMPVLMPLMDKMTVWVAANKELIASKLAAWLETIVGWVKQIDFDRVLADIGKLVALADKAINLTDSLVNRGLGSVLYDKTHEMSADEPLGIRQNNPGNLRSWKGAGSANGFAAFDNPFAGIEASARNVMAYQDKHQIDTIAGLVHRWAPAADHNDEPKYRRYLSLETERGENEKLDFHDPKILTPLLAGIFRMENGKMPYDWDLMKAATNQAIELTVHGLPGGVSMTAKTGPSTIPVKTGGSLALTAP